jgi:putative FmdB family regulatory protein
MPYYDYACPACGNVFEASSRVDDREYSTCSCGAKAKSVILKAPRLDSRMGLDPSFPSAAAKWRAAAERRGRGEDMTSANKDVQVESIHREAHEQRALLGKNPVTVS